MKIVFKTAWQVRTNITELHDVPLYSPVITDISEEPSKKQGSLETNFRTIRPRTCSRKVCRTSLRYQTENHSTGRKNSRKAFLNIWTNSTCEQKADKSNVTIFQLVLFWGGWRVQTIIQRKSLCSFSLILVVCLCFLQSRDWTCDTQWSLWQFCSYNTEYRKEVKFIPF